MPNNPILVGAVCHANDCGYWWNAFFPQGFNDPSGFFQCAKCKRITAKFMPDLWFPKNGANKKYGNGDGIEVA